MKSKRCSSCKEDKSLDDFHRLRSAADGRQATCKACRLAYFKRPEVRMRAQLRQNRRYAIDRATKVASARRWKQQNPEAIREQLRLERQTVKGQARAAVHHALQSGALEKPDHCTLCFKPTPTHRLQGHHEDYSKPLEVRWLCNPCHGAIERKYADRVEA